MRRKYAGIAVAALLLSNERQLSAQSGGTPQQPSSSSTAPSKPAPDPDALAKARKRFNEGVAFAQKQDWPKPTKHFWMPGR
jgi:hypothetical protein